MHVDLGFASIIKYLYNIVGTVGFEAAEYIQRNILSYMPMDNVS